MKKETSQVLWATSLGALAGGVAALLLAPASGKDTRQKLAKSIQRLKNPNLRGGDALSSLEENAQPLPQVLDRKPL
jgi:gas vesicle protein